MPFSARFIAVLLACGALALSLPALADSKKDKKDKDAAAKPALVATYGDWSVYRSDSGKGRLCYTLATPKTRDPDDAQRDRGLRLHLRTPRRTGAQRSFVRHGF